MPVDIRVLQSSEVTMDTAEGVQRMRWDGWRAALPERSEDERQILNFLGGVSFYDILGIQRNLRKIAKTGALAVAFADERIVGYGAMVNEVSPLPGAGKNLIEEVKNAGTRGYKRVIGRLQPDSPAKVYAKVLQVVTSPEEQFRGQHIGARLVLADLESGRFRDNQPVTAYVFDEDRISMHALPQWGFEIDPPDQSPARKTDYFGPDYPAVHQWRFKMPSVPEARERLNHYISGSEQTA